MDIRLSYKPPLTNALPGPPFASTLNRAPACADTVDIMPSPCPNVYDLGNPRVRWYASQQIDKYSPTAHAHFSLLIIVLSTIHVRSDLKGPGTGGHNQKRGYLGPVFLPQWRCDLKAYLRDTYTHVPPTVKHQLIQIYRTNWIGLRTCIIKPQ